MKHYRDNLDIASIGLEMGGCVALGYLAGAWVDANFGTAPWGSIVLLASGFGAALKGFLRVCAKTRAVMNQPEPAAVQPVEQRT